MKNILFLCFSIVSVFSFAQTEKRTKSKLSDFYLEYTTATKTVIIRGTSITMQDWIEQYDNPISSMPDSRTEVLRTGTISNEDLQTLFSLIKSSNFMALPKNEYGTSKDERHYPYMLMVKQNGKEKSVLYRSNPEPETESLPEAFDMVEKMVNEFSAKIK